MMSESLASADVSGSRPRSRLQFGLRGMLLLTALAAVWGTHFLNQRSIEHLEARVAVLRQMAAELTVDDPSCISVVKRPPLWFGEEKWDLFLPVADCRLCLATEDVDEKGLASVDHQVLLPQGRVRLELVQDRIDSGWRVTVLQDDQPVIVVEKPDTWNAGIGSSGGGHYDIQREFAVGDEVVLMRRRFMISTGPNSNQTPQGPAAGVLLWIEEATADARAIAP